MNPHCVAQRPAILHVPRMKARTALPGVRGSHQLLRLSQQCNQDQQHLCNSFRVVCVCSSASLLHA